MLQESLPRILDKIKADLSNNELFVKKEPNTNEIEKVAQMIAEAMLQEARDILVEYLQDSQTTKNAVVVEGEVYRFKEVVSKKFCNRSRKTGTGRQANSS